MGWAAINSALYFLIAHKLRLLRVDPFIEIIGLDRYYFSGPTNKDITNLKQQLSSR